MDDEKSTLGKSVRELLGPKLASLKLASVSNEIRPDSVHLEKYTQVRRIFDDAAFQTAIAVRKKTASSVAAVLLDRINRFKASAGSDSECIAMSIGTRLVVIDSIEFDDAADLIFIVGETVDGHRVESMRHFTQVVVDVVLIPRPSESAPMQNPIGFHQHVRPLATEETDESQAT